MLNDKFNNPIYQQQDLFELIYKNYTNFQELVVEDSKDIKIFEQYSEKKLKKYHADSEKFTVEQFDKICQSDWFIPQEYKNMDIERYLVDICPKENYQRLIDELQEYGSRGLLDLLRALKYVVDTLRKHNILWGVGRGSNVSSYVLFLLEVHRIDSVKYNLDWREFLR